MTKASISIFRNKGKDAETSTPFVPDEVFLSAKRVIETKGCEVVKTTDGLYVVKYSESGPYQDAISNEWLPVYIAKVIQWSSGGIKKTELQEFDRSH